MEWGLGEARNSLRLEGRADFPRLAPSVRRFLWFSPRGAALGVCGNGFLCRSNSGRFPAAVRRLSGAILFRDRLPQGLVRPVRSELDPSAAVASGCVFVWRAVPGFRERRRASGLSLHRRRMAGRQNSSAPREAAGLRSLRGTSRSFFSRFSYYSIAMEAATIRPARLAFYSMRRQIRLLPREGAKRKSSRRRRGGARPGARGGLQGRPPLRYAVPAGDWSGAPGPLGPRSRRSKKRSPPDSRAARAGRGREGGSAFAGLPCACGSRGRAIVIHDVPELGSGLTVVRLRHP